jgi:hypothetical protein
VRYEYAPVAGARRARTSREAEMAVAIEMRFRGATVEQYDEVIRQMGFEPGGVGAVDGGIFHWAAPTDDGLVVVDVWESDEQFDRFAQEQIGPLTQAAGIAPPEVTRYHVHNTLVSPAFAAARA